MKRGLPRAPQSLGLTPTCGALGLNTRGSLVVQVVVEGNGGLGVKGSPKK